MMKLHSAFEIINFSAPIKQFIPIDRNDYESFCVAHFMIKYIRPCDKPSYIS